MHECITMKGGVRISCSVIQMWIRRSGLVAVGKSILFCWDQFMSNNVTMFEVTASGQWPELGHIIIIGLI